MIWNDAKWQPDSSMIKWQNNQGKFGKCLPAAKNYSFDCKQSSVTVNDLSL